MLLWKHHAAQECEPAERSRACAQVKVDRALRRKNSLSNGRLKIWQVLMKPHIYEMDRFIEAADWIVRQLTRHGNAARASLWI